MRSETAFGLALVVAALAITPLAGVASASGVTIGRTHAFELVTKPSVSWTSPSVDSAQPKTVSKKSMWKAAALSLAVPGAGEWYLGKRNKAKIFMAVEVAAWSGFAAFKIYSNWKKDDLINYAHEHAGADLAGRDDAFLDLVGFYSSTREYNTDGRVGDRERPYLDESPRNYWQWQTDDEREIYRNLKNAGREANRRSQFLIGLAVVNRIASVIDAVRDARRQERSLDDSFSDEKPRRIQLAIDPADQMRQVKLTILTGW